MKTTPPTGQRPEQELYLLLTDLFYLLDDTDRQFFGEYGLSTRQFWALHHLSVTAGLSMIDLSRLLFTDKSNVTAIGGKVLSSTNCVQSSPSLYGSSASRLLPPALKNANPLGIERVINGGRTREPLH